MSNEINPVNSVEEAQAFIAEEEAKMQSVYTEIGKLYYVMHSADSEETFKPYIDELVASSGKIAKYNQQIMVLKDIPVCPECGAKVKKESVFCTACGARLKDEEVVIPEPLVPSDEYVICVRCASRMKKDMRFCTVCGNELSGKIEPTADYQPTKVYEEEPLPPADPEPIPAADPEPIAEPVTSEDRYAVPEPSVICPKCGKVSPPSYRFCVGCGSRLSDDGGAEPAANHDPVRCPNCGHVLSNPSMPFCTECGTRLK